MEFELKKRNVPKAPFLVIYGPAGVGKTTLPFDEDCTVYLPTEDGAGELNLPTLTDGVLKSYDEMMSALRYLYGKVEELGITRIVVDSIDHLEPLVWDHVCATNNWDSIEAPGYGRGYIECEKVWLSFINALLKIRDDKGVAIVCIGHDVVRAANDPMTGPYDSHELKLHKRAVALFKEKSDMIGLLKNLVVTDAKTGKGKGGSTPTLLTRPNAAYTAKTRYTKMPSSIPIPKEGGWEKVTQYIPFYNKDLTTEN